MLPPIIKFAPLLLLEVLLFVLITGGSLRDLDWFMSLRLDDIEIDLFLDDAEYKRNGSIVVVVVVVVAVGDLRLDTHTDEGEDTDKDEGDKDAADVDDVNINGIFL